MQTETSRALTANMILNRLQEKVSKSNAKLLFDSAKVQAGFQVDHEVVLEVEQAKALCLVMIKQGGPSFHVGTSIYKEYLM